MLYYAIVFAILALIFGALGFRGAASGFATIARFLLVLFLILFLLTLLFGNRFFPRLGSGFEARPSAGRTLFSSNHRLG